MKTPPKSLAKDRRRARGVRDALLRWYDGAKRDLPWRRSRDPYAIWISETMLQQTRVDTVIPYYERFLERFPDVYALATADNDDVFGLWAGLGYYSRARNLKAAAQQIVAEFGGELPCEASRLQSLPGIGRYTAGAVASIAFDQREPLVDGNVARVLTRLLAIREDIRLREVSERLWREAAALADGPRPGDLNQALMELGATVCTTRAPACRGCPLVRRCAAYRDGLVDELPHKSRAKAPQALEATAVWLTRRGRILAVRRPSGGLMGGLWELPGGDCKQREKPGDALKRALRGGLGIEAMQIERIGQVQHVFSHRKLKLHVFRAAHARGRIRRTGFDAHQWLPPAALGGLPHGAATRKALALLTQENRP